MPQLIKPSTQVKVVPRDGELEITLNINISVDGNISASSDEGEVSILKKNEDKINYFIPDFSSDVKLDFGKI